MSIVNQVGEVIERRRALGAVEQGAVPAHEESIDLHLLQQLIATAQGHPDALGEVHRRERPELVQQDLVEGQSARRGLGLSATSTLLWKPRRAYKSSLQERVACRRRTFSPRRSSVASSSDMISRSGTRPSTSFSGAPE